MTVLLAIVVLWVGVVVAVAVASTRRYRRTVARPGFVTRPLGQRRLP